MSELTINTFQSPWLLLLLLIPPLLLYRQLRNRREIAAVTFSDLLIVRGRPITFRQRIASVFPYTRCLALCLGVVALARPQFGTVEFTDNTLGIDIAMVIDVSGSMQMQDYPPNRLEVAKSVAADFVGQRTNDRISVVIFGEGAALLAPPTRDVRAVQTFIRSIYSSMIRDQATAVGDGLALAVRKLQEVGGSSRVAILLTDGESNSGQLTPTQAADIAKALGVRVYTIGMTSNASTGGAGILGFPMPAEEDIGEEELRQIADITGGKYFRATNESALRSIYDEIDQLEKTEIEVNEFSNFDERFMFFWLPGLFLLGLEILTKAFLLRRIP